MEYSPLLADLIAKFQVLPGVGKRTAQRMAFALLSGKRQAGIQLSESLGKAMREIKECSVCRNYSETDVCAVCSSERRKSSGVLCVVESPADVVAIENTACHQGTYFVLHGKISPLDGIGPSDVGIDLLEALLEKNSYHELIIALSPTVEGNMTSLYIAEIAERAGISVTRLSQGIPVGGEINNLDENTLSYSLANRKKFS